MSERIKWFMAAVVAAMFVGYVLFMLGALALAILAYILPASVITVLFAVMQIVVGWFAAQSGIYAYGCMATAAHIRRMYK